MPQVNDASPAKVAVIGGSGFIGSAISSALVDAGYEVAILDISPPSRGLICEYLPFDLRDWQSGSAARSTYSCVIIAAGILGRRCGLDPMGAWSLNVSSTIGLLSSLTQQEPRPRVIFLSTGMVYDSEMGQGPFSERDHTRARCLYTSSKLCVEAALRAAGHGQLITSLVLRPFTVYGDRLMCGSSGHLFGRWLEFARAGKPIPVYGDGSQIIDPVHVDYVADACRAYLSIGEPPPTLTVNVTSGGCVTVGRLASLFVEAGLAPDVQSLPAVVADMDRGWGSPDALEELLGRPLRRDPDREIADFLRAYREES